MGTLEPVLTNIIVSSYDGDVDDRYVLPCEDVGFSLSHIAIPSLLIVKAALLTSVVPNSNELTH